MRGLHEKGAARVYLTTIARDNPGARAVLTSGRAGLPGYHPAGAYVTAAIPVRRDARAVPLDGGRVTPATEADRADLAAFWRDVGARRQFFPAVEPPPNGRLAGMSLGDVLIARRGERIVGTVARWDQHAYKQWQLVSYGWKMTLARPVFAVLAAAFGWPPLPRPGTRIASVYAALAAVENDAPDVLESLLTALVVDARGRGDAFVSIGMLDGDPLLAVVKTMRPFLFLADLFLVTFDPAGDAARTDLDRRPWYVELATL